MMLIFGISVASIGVATEISVTDKTKLCERTSNTNPERHPMKTIYTFVSDNAPLLFICLLVAGIAATLLSSTTAYIHAWF
jgi:hypothetical protein